MRIYLDVDGVLVDFIGAASRLHGKRAQDVTGWDFFAKWGVTDDEFWGKIDDVGEDFWANLPEYPWCDELIELVEKIDPQFHLATTPSRSPSSAAGKLKWIRRKFGDKFNRYFMCGHDKSRMAAADSILIDDGEHNVDAWMECAGNGCLFPQPWNRNRGYEDKMAYVRGSLEIVEEYLEKLCTAGL